MSDVIFMTRAISEMNRCKSFPKVGCAIVKDNKLISTGYRDELPGKHAERAALEKISEEDSKGTTLYTTLEPCTRIKDEQKTLSCSELIVARKVAHCVIGVFDPNGKIYVNGWKFLTKNSVKVSFFNQEFQRVIESSTFKFNDFNAGYGSGSRRVRVERGHKPFTVYFSETDNRNVNFRWKRLNQPRDHFDIISRNESVLFAKNATDFRQIQNPVSFQDPSHTFRLGTNEIVVISSADKDMNLLVQLTAFSETDIEFKWQVRNA